jgi:hypothetical protein
MIQKDMIFLGQWVVKSIFLVSLLAPAYPPPLQIWNEKLSKFMKFNSPV